MKNSFQQKTGLLLAALCVVLCTQGRAQQFNIATYNLRYANQGDSANGNGWGQRLPVIATMVQFYGWDVFGTQEGLYSQLQGLQQSLSGYQYIGIGREDGRHAGEHSAIFYRVDKFEVLEKGDFWLSANTAVPNKGWDAVLPRICTWARFKEKSTGFTFYFYNLHMDHVGVQARAESAKLILAKIQSMPANTPVVLTGDFNVDQTSESYTLLNTSGLLHDAYQLSPVKLATTSTFNGFNPNQQGNSRIDHIFVTSHFTIARYGILTDSYRAAKTPAEAAACPASKDAFVARLPSDHFPVMVQAMHP
jgi:endonuclease/exonuclease/phosphatase family metal-dependent hydrolase